MLEEQVIDDSSEHQRIDGSCFVALTHDHLNAVDIMDRVRSPKAGAIVLFAGTTRDNFDGKPVKELEYTSYKPLALRTMMQICKEISEKHSLTAIALIHRLGVVPIAEESILIAVSSPHRQAAWRGGEEALEACKDKVEVWKREEFGGEDGGVWRANRDGAAGIQIDKVANSKSVVGSSHLPKHVERPSGTYEKGHGPVAHPIIKPKFS